MKLPKFAFFNGQIVPFEQANVSILTHAIHYGTAAFSGIRGYWNSNQNQLYLFRPIDHYRRLLKSAILLHMDFPYSAEELVEITKKLIQKESYNQDIYIRPIIYKSELGIGVRLHGLENELAITAMPFGNYVENDTNAHVTFSSWRRVDDNVIPARGKISGTYVNSAFVKTDALLAGFDEALVLTADGHVSEGSAENVFIVKDEQIITPPVTDNILEGITRRSVIKICKDNLDMPVIERSIDRSEVFLSDELFLTGTAAQITAVTWIDHRVLGTGSIGPITEKLRNHFSSIVHGDDQKYQYWLTAVYE